MTRGPTAPPDLARMAARKATHERAREEDFPRWRAALVAARGNVMRAGRAEFPDLSPRAARDAANRQVRRLGLVGFARDLRVAAGGRAGPGRPKRRVPDDA